ncbi:unnamed protein product [Caenorhabditis bovis]|uniref:Uncharacterized protein n=1 Tax=Caenorhabditis bovis TaxID=2654633 RepID=A0A8S1ELD7_9PELO|nr:unnamed protein product [Caenorhabditis bovis]
MIRLVIADTIKGPRIWCPDNTNMRLLIALLVLLPIACMSTHLDYDQLLLNDIGGPNHASLGLDRKSYHSEIGPENPFVRKPSVVDEFEPYYGSALKENNEELVERKRGRGRSGGLFSKILRAGIDVLKNMNFKMGDIYLGGARPQQMGPPQ